MDDEILTLEEVSALVKCGTSHIYACIKEGTFPRPRKMGKRSLWSKREVMAWFEALPVAPD